MRGVLAAALVFCFGAAAQAQQSTVTFSENFQSYGKSKKPAGWIDTKVGSPNVRPRGYYKTRIDPTQDKNGTNIVYGTTKSIRDKVDPVTQVSRGGYFAIYEPKVFSASGRFEATGRIIRVGAASRAGLTVLSGYPEKDKYYLIREESTGTAEPTLRLSAFGAGTPTGTLNSNVTLALRKWYRFRIATDSVNGATYIRARFWLEGTQEPATYSIEAVDASAARLTAGRFGVWAGGTDQDTDPDARDVATQANDDDDENAPPNKGTYVDDLNLKSPADIGLPTIKFFENGVQLDPATRADFARNAAVEIRVADELSTVTYTATLDNVAYRSLDPITTEGTHVVRVRAVDSVGNVAESQVTLLIDKTAPAIALLESGQPLADNAKFKRTAAVVINVTDALSASTFVAKLDGQPYASLAPIAAEGPHVLLVEATDAVGNRSTKQVRLVIDLTPPSILFFESGHAVDSTNAKFKVNPSIEIRVADALTNPTLVATLDGNPYTSLTPITVDGRHVISATATDEAGNSFTATLNLLVDKVAPVVVLLESNVVLDPAQTAIYKRNAAIDVRVTDTTSQVQWSAKLDNVEYTPLTPITTEQTHALTVHAVDEAGNVTDVTLSVLVDKTAPVVTFAEGATTLDPRTDNLFRHDVAIKITATDATSTATFTATLDGVSYTSLTPITTEGPHVIAVHATDTAGNVTDSELRFVVDKTKPTIVLTESNVVLPSGSQHSFGRDARVVIAVSDNLTGVTWTAKLDGSDYTSDAIIAVEGTHTLTVHAIDAAGNEADAAVTLLIDKSGPTIAFFVDNVELPKTEPKHKFKVRPAIEIRIADAFSTQTSTPLLDGAPYTPLTPIAEGIHTLSVHAVDALGNASDATISLLVDLTAPVVVLREGTNLLPATGGIFAHDLTITPDVSDLSTTTVTATLDDAVFPLNTPVAQEGVHTLKVTAIDELEWTTTVTSTFTIDKTAPKVTVLEGATPLLDGASFARDIILTASAVDITSVSYTATLDGAAYTLGNAITADGTHTIVVTGTDAAGNSSAPQTIRFHIERSNPEVRLLESGAPFPDGKTFGRDIVATISVTSATATTDVAKIDGASYTFGTPYGVEGSHTIVVTVTSAAGRTTTVDADFEIDKTKPTIRLMANGAPMTDDQTFNADVTPVAEADDNLTHPPIVVVTLDGQTLAPNTVVSEEKVHTISATATDRAGNSTTAGPLTFVLDKTDPELTVKVDGEPLVNGDQFKTPITPVIKAEDLTPTTVSATLDGVAYTLDTPISQDGSHTLVASATDRLNHVKTLPAITFVIDQTPPVVSVIENEAPFVTGAKYKRSVKPNVVVVDTTQYIITATLDGNVYTSGQEISSEGRHELSGIVTDELGWSTPIPTIVFTIDGTEPVVEVREGANLLVTGTIFNRDVQPTIVVTDATETVTEATLDGQQFNSGTRITTEGAHTLSGKVTDELGLFTPILPISFIIDKTAPVVVITESGAPFADHSLLNHDAVPQPSITDITAVTISATLDGAAYVFGTPIATEGAHTLEGSFTDAAGWTTQIAPIHFVIDKTAPVVAITDGGAPLVSGIEVGRSVVPVITVTDISTFTVVATLDGAAFASGSEVAADGVHTLAVTITDAAGWVTVAPPITFTIDKTKPIVQVLESGTELVSGTKFNRGVLPQIVVTDATATTIVAKLGTADYAPDTLIETEGLLTLSVVVTDRGGNVTTVPPISFTIDRTPPVVTITESGQPLTSGSAFQRNVKPEIAIQDITQTNIAATLQVGETSQPFTFGAELTAEGRYALNVTVTDELAWSTTVPTIGFFIDRTPPVVELVEDGKPLVSGALFNRAVEPRAIITDTTDTTVTAKLNGADYTLGTKIEAEGEYTLAVHVVDAVGLFVDVPPVTFRIDTTKPVISFITPTTNQSLIAPRVLVTGNADDAVKVEVNGVLADIDTAAKRFTVPALELLEGPNTIVALGTDAAGNVSDPVSVDVSVDTRAPELAITAPAANACLTTKDLQVTGTISDPHVSSVRIVLMPGNAAPVDATLSADGRTWSAAMHSATEGKFVIAVTARDNGGHESVVTVQVRIDQTKPVIEITEGGSPFNAPFVNHPVAPFVRAVDADPTTTLTVTLDGAPYVSGTQLAAEKAYELKASATDCAGNQSDDAIVRFVIDRTPPQFLTLSPANGASIGAMPTVSGTVSPDAASVFVQENNVAANVANGAFSFGSLAIHEGVNRFTLVAIDRAGNRTALDYSFTLKTSAPTIDIVENGSPIANGARYNRAVTVDLQSNESDATITATHNGQPFTSGTSVGDNGSHAIHATATDAFGHSSSKDVAFTVDRDGPVVTITEPQDGATVSVERIRVRGTVTGEPVSATINGAPLTLTGNAFDTEVPLEIGLNEIMVMALDGAGNAGVAKVEVTRGAGTLGIILNSPVGSAPTNRRTTTVAGQVLSPAGVSFVTVNGIEIPIDAAGAFRKTDFALNEGQNVITATVRKDAAQGSVSVTVTADFTPPAVTVRESGNALDDESRFPTQANITVTATDAGQSITPALLIDGAVATSPVVVTITGGHTLVATARDIAGNETRVERTFFIGSGVAGGCALTDFDPPTGAVVTSNTVTLVGRTGGAPGVKVNGTAAVVSNGSFSATVNLPNEGANTVTINCTDANGTNTGTPATITLTRVTGAPSIHITSPDDHSPTANETITVSGTIAGEVTQVLVNGTAATINGTSFTASNVRLASGVNIIVARARNAAGRTSTDSIQVTWLKNLPTITISSPATAFIARTATIDVSGVFTNLDPASLTVTRAGTGAPVQTTLTSDTAGTFLAPSVPLSIGLQTITVRGADRLGRIATATIDVTRADGKPAITIAAPLDNSWFDAASGATFPVSGSFNASTAATIEVNGEVATIDAAASTFTANVPFATLTSTPVIARITEPDGSSSLDAVRVNKLGAAPRVVQTFPDADAVDVDPGTLPLVLFSASMDRASVRSAFRLENAAGAPVSGDVTLDRDVLTFAPAVLLSAGERYTMRIAASAADLAGNTLGSEFTRAFTIAATAPIDAPTLNAYAARVCDTLTLTGTAPADVRVRIDLGSLSFNTTASSTGAFSFTLPLSGRSGFQVARVRVVGSDGSLSAAAEAKFEVDCAGPQVVDARFDRPTNVLTVTFSKPIDIATITTGANGSARLQLTDGTIVGGTVAALSSPTSISITPAQNLGETSFTLAITTAVKDTNGAALTAPFSRAFTIGEPTLGDGAGYISGEIFDADTGRPLPGATVSIEVPVGAFARGLSNQSVRSDDVSATSTAAALTDNRGRYLRELPEGAHTIRASADGYTTVWRQIIVRAGAGVIPTDIRLTRRGSTANGNGSAATLTHGGGTAQPLALASELRIPAGILASGQNATLTSLGAQSLAGLLPLGWSPLASAEIVSNAPSLSGAELTFTVPASKISSANQTLTAVRYYDDRDEWRVVSAVVTLSGDKATIPVSSAGAYALVYPDKGPRLQTPANPAGGAVLHGVTDPCTAATCPPLAAKEALQLVPPVVLPTQRTIATLRIEGANTSLFPSGTAVQAYVDEELQLADGTRDVVAPFATDLLLYRTLDGEVGEATFHLAPSARASEVVLEVGYDHIRIVPYPERLDRGALIGPEGGRVPADDTVAVEIPAGATTEALQATATSITDFASYGSIPGYRIVGGLALTLQWPGVNSNEGSESSPVELFKPARATFTVSGTSLPAQLILVEVLEGTPYGRIFHLASQITALEGGTRFSTKTIDRAVLPVDGIIREGRYLLLAPDAPIAFATGTVHLGINGPATAGARVLTPSLGVIDLTRITGIFNVPVPAAVFSLIPRTIATGDGATYTHPSAPAVDAVVHVGALSIVAQPPTVAMTVFAHRTNGLVEVTADGATEVSPTTSIKAAFSPGLDPQSVSLNSLTVIDDSNATVVPGRAVANGTTGITWTLEPGSRLRADTTYTAVVSQNVRGSNGTPLGNNASATFATVSTLNSPNVDASKIRITMPDANGRAQIIGAPGALAEHWNAVAIRRGRDFSNRPQDTADAQRSFLIELGTGNDPLNRVTIADEIYLQIINEAGAVAAIVQLGPFTTADGRGFVARPEKALTFTTADNIKVAVPAGAFDVPTLVRIDPAAKTSFDDVPGINEELSYFAGFKVDFEGVAKKRLDITFPTPANLPADKSAFLGYHGISAQGPRIMVVDLLRRDGGNLTTTLADGNARTVGSLSARGVGGEAIVNPTILRDMLLGIDRGALLIGFTFQTSVSWISFAPPPVPPDFFIPPIKSIYFASFAAERDRILVPVAANGAFNIVGIDPGTGMEVFNAPYSALTPGEPDSLTQVTLPSTNDRGPYPVFASPGRTEILDINSDKFTDESIRNIKAVYDGSSVVFSNGATPLPADTHVEVLNLRSGTVASTDNFASGGLPSVTAQRGDRLILLFSDHDVDPNVNVTVVFSEPIDAGTIDDLRDQFKLLSRDPSISGSTFQPVPGKLDIQVNSGGRRVSVINPGGYQRGKIYRVLLSNTINDGDTTLPLRLGQGVILPPPTPPGTPPPSPASSPTPGPLPPDMHFDFSVRAPKGLLDTFNITAGSVRDLAMIGNVLFISAQEGGIFAYDTSNPMAMGSSPAFARIAPPIGNDGATWALATDIHGRLYATGVTPMYGVVRSYRFEDFECGATGGCADPLPVTSPPNTPPGTPPNVQKGNAIIAWRTGINVGMPLASMIVGGWPEATPRRMKVVTRDEEPQVDTFENLVNGATDAGNGFQTGTLNLTSTGLPYDKQRVTVINVTRDYRWSADVTTGGSTAVTVVGQPQDELRIIRNLSTIGVVSLFGFGVGTYDLNAVDANYRHVLDSSFERLEDTYVLSDGEGNGANDCDKAQQAQMGRSCEIGSLKLSPESALTVRGDTVSILTLEQNRGLLHLTMSPSAMPGQAASFGRPGSMIFAERILIPGMGRVSFGHPRINQLRRLYTAAAGREPTPRYTSVDTFKRGGTTYALVTAFEYGLMVVKIDPVMKASSLVDVVWIPSGAQSVRVAESEDLAVVVDGKGRVLLVNLAGLDETALLGTTPPPPCGSLGCEWPLFPTALAAITGAPAGPGEVGANDPRIVWQSVDPLPPDSDGVVRPMVFGTLAPYFDSDTGFIYAGSVLQTKMRVISAVDPHVRFVGQTGVGTNPTGLKLLDRIVPLGIKPPAGSVAGINGSLAAFRLQVVVPGSMEESLSGPPHINVDTENIIGTASPQTAAPLPRSRFRQTGARSVTGFELIHDAPATATDTVKKLRYQRGWNRMTTPWIVAIADPRAAKDYWPADTTVAQMEAEHCFACARPDHLDGRPEPEVFELFTAGRSINAYPSTSDLTGDWDWLGDAHRLDARINTIPADTVRPIPVLVAAQAPAVAGGMLQETTYVHSGEIETSAIDFDAGGRAGWNVIFDRTYRSRTLYESPFGQGWDSSIFRRLRQMPNNDVEYRDGAEVWTFKYDTTTGVYTSPAGLAVSLKRADRGWTIVDQKFRITTFDELGRIVRESDEFFKLSDPVGTGNVIQYGYDALGHLTTITDPVGRQSTLTYYAAGTSQGLVDEITDWHLTSPARKIKFTYDAERRLTKVQLPDVVNTLGSRPEVNYDYFSGGSYKDTIELRANLKSITDPEGGGARVSFEYGTSGLERDHVTKQTWGTNEFARMSYPSATTASVTDVLGQERKYTLTQNSTTDVVADRAHVTDLIETSVPVWSGAVFGELPATVEPTPDPPVTPGKNRVWKFGYTAGMQTSVTLEGVSNTTIGYTDGPANAGKMFSNATTGPDTTNPPAATPAPWMPTNDSVTRTYEYQSGTNATGFVKAVTIGDKRVESPEAHRTNVDAVDASNDSISESDKYEKNGLLSESSSSGGTDTSSAGSKTKIDYFQQNAPDYKRFLPQFIHEGTPGNELVTEFRYPTDSQVTKIDPRGVTTITDLDTWGRTTHVRVTNPGAVAAAALTLDATYEYDANGRLEKVTQKKGSDQVETSYTYDVMGRRKTTTTNNIATVNSVTTSVVYDLANHKTITTRPGGATTTTEVDQLGRPKSTTTNTGSSPINQRFAYDLAGNLVYSTDLFIASATAYDSNGRAIATRGSDGTITTAKHDGMGNATDVATLMPSGTETIAASSTGFSTSGRAQSYTSPSGLTTSVAWDGAGRTTGTAVGDRASHTTFDVAGRPLTQMAGQGSATSISDVFFNSEFTSHDGALPATKTSSEKGGPDITTSMQRNTVGSVTQSTTGSLQWNRKYDELGHVTEASTPGRPATQWDVDARGAVKNETLPDGAQNQYAYHGSGAQSGYTDPTSEATNTVTDLIGRPTSRTYPDGTSEVIEWEGSRLKSVTDRQGRKQTYVYNAKGQLFEVQAATGTLDRITYDDAGRVVSWKTPDTEVIFEQFDAESRPQTTKQRRFRNGSGLTSSSVLLDEFVQTHTYNTHGERTFYSMPIYTGLALASGWSTGVTQGYDAMGNVSSITRGGTLMTATYRNAGRPDTRTVTMAGGGSMTRTYTYDDTTAQLRRFEVTNASGTIAGSEVTYDGLQKASAKILGLSSGERYQHWSYDARSRVTASLYGVTSPTVTPATAVVPGRTGENLSPADFRTSQDRTPKLDTATRAAMQSKGIDPTTVDPPSSTFGEQSGHKIASMTQGPQARTFGYQGAERIDDGLFTYEFDVKGRLIRATEKATAGPVRRIVYEYSGTGRLVGRRAEYASSAASPSWQLENRPQILNLDGLPAETTFVWDPISDRLLSVFKAGATATTDANGGLLKQIIHGDSSYDDPLETATIDPSTGNVTHLYPIYDEAGGGSLQAIVNETGEVVARNLAQDPYGAEDAILAGAAIDGVKVDVKKVNGNIDTVDVTLHATEELAQSSIANGARLAVVDSNGNLVRTATVTPDLDATDKFTLRWSLSATEWTALTDPTPVTVNGVDRTPVALSVGATPNLRASNWSSQLPILPPPDWVKATKPVFTTADLTVEVREPLSSPTLTTALSAGGTAKLYEIDAIALLAEPGSGEEFSQDIMSARMHAHPFTEPMTRLNYVRARWFDPATGSFLSADPAGYRDSSNLYAFAGGDPVNQSDPTGAICERRGGEGWWDWTKRCAQDVEWMAEEFNDGVSRDGAEMAVNAITLGGYNGVKKAYKKGELDQGGLSGAEAYLNGVTNTLTLGAYDTTVDTLNEGGTFGDAAKTWAGNVSGYTDVAEGAQKIGGAESLDDVIEGTGQILEGTGKAAGLILAAEGGVSRVKARLNRPPAPVTEAAIPRDPQSIRFSHDSIKAQFQNPELGSIDDLAEGLTSGRVKPSDVKPIRLIEGDEGLITIDNRRLEAFRRAGMEVPTRMATHEEILEAARTRKFSAGPVGTPTIRVRGKR